MSAATGERAVRRVIVLGSTGSIGVSTLSVIEHLNLSGPVRFEVVGLAAGGNARLLAEQAERFQVRHVALVRGASSLQRSFAGVCFDGEASAEQLVRGVDADIVVAAIVGFAGLSPTLAAIECGCDIALANKETLVAAGSLVIPMVEKHGVSLLPVDSEHSAIFQCLMGVGGAAPAHRMSSSHTARVARVVLTASGGAFRDADPASIYDATPERALRHPTWDMGPKVTIDSATMMNKALELIEAHHLFGLPPEKLTALIHPQSVVHSFVECTDHSVLAQLGPPDMRTPIQVALCWPDRVGGCSHRLDWTKLSRLDFVTPDPHRYPSIPLAYRVMRDGGTAGATFNAANEAAVEAFLHRRIPFGRIVELVDAALHALPARAVTRLDDVFNADAQARAYVMQQLESSVAATSTPGGRYSHINPNTPAL